MKDATFQKSPDEFFPTRRRGGRFFGLSMLVTLPFVAGFILARTLPDWPTRWSSQPEPHCLLRIEPPTRDLMTGQPNKNQFSLIAFLNTQVHLATSPNVLRAALASKPVAGLESIKRQPDPETWLRKNLRVVVVPNTLLMRISAQGRQLEISPCHPRLPKDGRRSV